MSLRAPDGLRRSTLLDGLGECVFSGIYGRMAETKSLWEEPDTGHQLTQEAHSTDRRRVARRPRSSRRPWRGLLLRIESP